jgi:cell division cycle 20-like protein 1, cofactor of APC complex
LRLELIRDWSKFGMSDDSSVNAHLQGTSCESVHSTYTGTLAWNNDCLSSGGRDRVIFTRDTRKPSPEIFKMESHKQEVCGLKWNTEKTMLASGGNDNKLFIWDQKNGTKPLWTFEEHSAAVKAISWSPQAVH